MAMRHAAEIPAGAMSFSFASPYEVNFERNYANIRTF